MIPEKPKMIIKIWKIPTPAAKEQKVEMKKNVFFWKKIRCSWSQSNFAFLTIYFQMNKQSSEKLLWNWKLEKRCFRFFDFLTSKNYRIYLFVPNFAWIYKKILERYKILIFSGLPNLICIYISFCRQSFSNKKYLT